MYHRLATFFKSW